MGEIAFVLIPYFSHVQSMVTLAQQLHKRGHRITLYGTLDALAFTRPAELDGMRTQPYAAVSHPLGSSKPALSRIGSLTGYECLHASMAFSLDHALLFLRDALPVIRDARPDLLVIDQACPGYEMAAEVLDIPYVHMCSALLLLIDGNAPPFFSHRVQSSSIWSFFQNITDTFPLLRGGIRLTRALNQLRNTLNLPPYPAVTKGDDTLSPYAVLSAMTERLEFPRWDNLPQVHFIGRWCAPDGSRPFSSDDLPFDFKWLDNSKPLVYISFGVMFARIPFLWGYVTDACAKMTDLQFILSTGNDPADLGIVTDDLATNHVKVCQMPPQRRLLQLASVVVSHAGMNTVLEALEESVPLVCLPVAGDQPGVAARVSAAGAGVMLDLSSVDADAIVEAVRSVMRDEAFRRRAAEIGKSLRKGGGACRAAEIVEQVLRTKRPVHRHKELSFG